MAVSDIKRRVTTVYAADVTNHKAGLLELEVKIGTLKAQEDDLAKARTKNADDAVSALKKIQDQYQLYKTAITDVMDTVEAAANRARLEVAAHGADLDKLSAAAGGTKTQLELLTFAAKTQHAAFALNNDQMVDVQRAMRELTREGYDQQTVNDAVTESVLKLSDRGLKQLGIRVAEGSSDREKFANILQALHEKSKQLDDSQDSLGESVGRANASMADSFDHLKEAAGRLVAGLAPLIEKLAKLGGLAADVVDKVAKDEQGHSAIGNALLAIGLGEGAREIGDAYVNERNKGDISGIFTPGQAGQVVPSGPGRVRGVSLADVTGPLGDFADQLKQDALQLKSASSPLFDVEHTKELAREREKQSEEYTKSREELTKVENKLEEYLDSAANVIARSLGVAGQALKLGTGDTASSGPGLGSRFVAPAANDNGGFGQLKASGIGTAYIDPVTGQLSFMPASVGGNIEGTGWSSEDQTHSQFDSERLNNEAAGHGNNTNAQLAGNQKFLEKTFGKVSDFDIYSEAFKSLTGAVSSSLKAWIDGSESASKAFKQFIASTLEGLASQMAIEALKEGAYALGSLAIGDYSGAAAHGLAAAEFAAGAAAAAIAAKELGVGSRASTGQSPAGVGAGVGGSSSTPTNPNAPTVTPNSGNAKSGSSSSNKPIVIVTGNDGIDETPRERQARYQKIVEQAYGTNSVVAA